MIFVPSSATWPSFTSPACSHSFTTCPNSPESAFKCRLRKSETVGIRRIEPDNAQEVEPFARRLGDPARRVDAVAIAVQQQRRHHRRVKRRLPALARIRGFDLTKVERLEHKRQNEASQMVLADKVLNARRQQQRLIDRPGPEGLAHKRTKSDSSKRRHHNPLLSRQAPRMASARRVPDVIRCGEAGPRPALDQSQQPTCSWEKRRPR